MGEMSFLLDTPPGTKITQSSARHIILKQPTKTTHETRRMRQAAAPPSATWLCVCICVLCKLGTINS